MAKIAWASDWKVGIRVWIEREGLAVLGEGKADLLAAIEREHSITKAAKAAGMSYRRAWTMIQEVNKAAGEVLVEAAVGGKQGGGARLTERGRLALEVYEQVRQSLVESAASVLVRSVRADKSAAAFIHLSAAISLQEAIGQILAEFTLVEPSVRVRTIFGASNELADQLLAGAPGDVFLSAEPAEVDRLVAAKLVVRASRRPIARNGLAIIGPNRSHKVARPADLMSNQFRRVALAEPACPLGRYSKTYLEKTLLYNKLISKVVHVDNSRAVLAAVVSGFADAGVAFSSDAASAGSWQTLFRVPASQAATTYEAAIVGRNKNNKQARLLCDFLSSPLAARAYRRCGLKAV